jgi:predicted CXXCH cytochrome family protein
VKGLLAAVAVAGVFAVGACTEDTVVQERPPFNPAPDGAFLGYYVVDTVAGSRTTCGNCHADQDKDWRGTIHAHAWEGLQSSDHAASYCEGCHAISENGSVWPDSVPAGINALDSNDVLRAVYYDVQCESCHGPGSDHVAAPASTYPLASLDASPSSCGDCHEGSHHPFVEQWNQSAHGNVTGFASGRSGCNECHNGRGALLTQFNETANYLERDDPMGAFDITCSVCHDPHGGPFEHQLRAPLDLASSRNLCVKCHNRRTIPEPGGTHGPHGAQGPLLFADNIGWWPDGLEWNENELQHEHGDPAINEELCATCHVVEQEITDAVTGDVIHSVGHTFEPIPCYDGSGMLTDPPCSNNRWEACEACHLNPELTFEANKDSLTNLLLAMWDDVNGDGILNTDVPPADTGLLVRIMTAHGAGVINFDDTVHTVAEGLLFNSQIAWTEDTPWFADGNIVVGTDTVHFSSHPTSGQGVHNPTFLDAIMRASLAMGASFYSVAPPAGVNLEGPYTLPAGW